MLSFSSNDAIEKAIQSEQFVVVGFIEKCNPAATFVGEELSKLDSELDYINVCLTDDEDAFEKFSINVVPSTMFFYKGQPLDVRRQGWDDDDKFVGQLTGESWSAYLRYARESIEKYHINEIVFDC